MSTNYRIYDRTGSGSTHDITATDLDDAIEQGRAWIEDGDWSSEDGVMRIGVTLPCQVREIIRETYYVDVYAPGTARDLRGPMTEDEARALCDGVEVSLDLHDGVIEQIKGTHADANVELVEAWAEDEDSESYRAIYRVTGSDVDGSVNDDLTDDGQANDCSGSYSDTEPECEVGGGDDDGGHDWRSPHCCVGGIRENPGVWSGGGTTIITKQVCAKCGCYRTETDNGSQRNHDEPQATVKYQKRDEASEQWMAQITGEIA